MNGPNYKAMLLLERLAKRFPDASADLWTVRGHLSAQAEELRRAKLHVAARKDGRVPPLRGNPGGAVIMGTPTEQAQAICGADGPIDVYRFPSGAVTWRKRGMRPARGGEFIGSYDDGSDWRRVAEDLSCDLAVAA